jgi:superoxide dismutase, Fe-Mn family
MQTTRRGFITTAGLLATSLLTSRVIAAPQGSTQPTATPRAAGATSGNVAAYPAAWRASGTHTLPALPYAVSALEPHIDARTMEIHHTRHHQKYVEELNLALDKYPDLKAWSLADLLLRIDQVPEDIRNKVRNSGGGHANHSLFWEVMAPNTSGQPTGPLLTALNDSFGGFDKFKGEFSAAAKDVFGSGWAWLVRDGSGFTITTNQNQDSPLLGNHWPVLGLDVWEHAYYLKYQNKRPDYIAAWWNVVNWPRVSELAGL